MTTTTDPRLSNLMTSTITEGDDGASTTSSIMDDEIGVSKNGSSGDLEQANNDSTTNNDKQQPLAKQESLGVSRMKIVVTLLLVINAVLVLVACYLFLRQQEQKTFENAFESHAQTIADATHYHARGLEETYQSASDIITSYTLDTQKQWPFVTIPHFEIRSEHMRLESFTDVVGWAPLLNGNGTVEYEQALLEQWGIYAQYQQGWIAQSYATIATHDHGDEEHEDEHGEHGEHEDGHDEHEDEHEHEEEEEHHDEEEEDSHHDHDHRTLQEAGGDAPTTATSWISPTVFDYEDDQHGAYTDTLHAPIWQMSPPPKQPKPGETSPLINLDLFSLPVLKDLYNQAVETSYTAVSEVLDLDFFMEAVVEDYHYDTEDSHEEAAHNHQGHEKPRAVLFQPVYDRHHEHTMGHAFYDEREEHEHPPQVVGLLFGIISWEHYLENMLPDSVRGIYVVLSNSCGQAYTFEVSGSHAVFIGPGDRHDPAFQELQVEAHFGAFVEAQSEDDHDDHEEHGGHDDHEEEQGGHDEHGGHDEVEVVKAEEVHDDHHDHVHKRRLQHDDHDHGHETEEYDVNEMDRDATGKHDHAHNCHYYIHIYPSQQLRDTYTTSMPWIVTAVVLFIFFITGLTFWLYVRCISHRQKKVVAIATKTNLVVRELFPAAVRDQIMQNAEEQAAAQVKTEKQSKKKQPMLPLRSKSRESYYSSGTSTEFLEKAKVPSSTTEEASASSNKPKGRPIADLYPDCTIFFADIVGFTKWSSTREPTHVFELLEGIYGEFDAIARKRKVFKVETIGDCYVAACGLPNPNAQHAVVTARFANDCIKALPSILESLAPTLGEETLTLGMRVGLHSGPVTAGVLRGERGRFQLFGDTVNTAARMESNGVKNKIHCSMETSDCLIAAGRHHWITLREDKISAKGKGVLQTCWIDVSSHKKGSSSSTSDDPTHTLNQSNLNQSSTISHNGSLNRSSTINHNSTDLSGIVEGGPNERNLTRSNSNQSDPSLISWCEA